MTVPLERIWAFNDWIEVMPAKAGTEFSYTNMSDPGELPARIDIFHADAGVEAITLDSAEDTDALIAALQQFRKEVWGDQ